jgi:hypothetical protein
MVDTLFPGSPLAVALAGLLLVAGALAVWLPWRRGRPALALGALVAAQGLALLGVAVVRAPQYEARFPAREFATRVRAQAPGGQPILSLLDDYNFLVAFYVDRPLTPVPGVAELLAAAGAGGPGPRLALVDHGDRAILGRPDVTILEEARLGPKRIVLVRLGPPA